MRSTRLHPGRVALALGAVLAVAAAVTCGGGDDGDGGGDGEPRKVARERPRRPLLTRELAPQRITDETSYDTQPALALDATDTPWVVWVGNTEREGDRLLAARRDADGGWTAPELVTPQAGMYVRPVLVRAGDEMVALWTATGETTGIWSARSSGDGWSAPEPVSPDGHHFNPEACVDREGRVWAVWQGRGVLGFDIYLASDDGSGWSAPIRMTDHHGNDWDPAIACDLNGVIKVVWTGFRDSDYDLYLVDYRTNGELSREYKLTDHGAYDLHPSIVVDERNRLWVAWDRIVIPDHGSSGKVRVEDGRLLNTPPPQDPKTTMAVLCLDGEAALAPTAAPLVGPATHHVTNSAFPQVALDDAGGVWVVYRGFSFKTSEPHVFWWDVIATRYTGSGWSAVEVLPYSDGNLEEPSIAVAGTSVWIAAEMEHRSTSRDFALHPEDGPTSFVYENHWPYMPQGVDGDVYVSRLGAGPTAPPPELVDPPMSADTPAPLASIVWLREPFRREIEHEGQTYRVLFGDTHRHSSISRCQAGRDATVVDHHRYGLDVHRCDFQVISDHSNHTSDFNWWTIQKLADMFYLPGTLATLMGYEISNGYPTGHKNVIFPGRPSRILRQGIDRASNGPEIWESLGGEEAITIPHTTSFRSGTDWVDHDPEYERLVEIFQQRTGSSEHWDAPRTHELSRNKAGFVHEALKKGYRLGFIASADHGFGSSYAVVFAKSVTREDVYEALHERRCYASSAYGILLDVRADGHLMGSEYAADGPAELTIEVEAYTAIDNIVLFADTRIARTWEAAEIGGKTASLAWTEPDPPVNADDARNYYVRVMLSDDELAWSSPIWVDYR